MDKHYNSTAEGQFIEAQKVFKTLKFTFPGAYFVTIRGKIYKIEITANYPRDTPDVYEADEVLPLSLPILEHWKPFFQMLHILNQLEVYSSITPYRLIHMTDIPNQITENNITSAEECWTTIEALKTAKKEASKKVKSTDFIIDDDLRDATNLYNTSKETFETIKTLKSQIIFSERDFYENEIMKLNDEIVKTQNELDQIINSIMIISDGNSTAKIDKNILSALIEIKGRDIALRKKKNILQDLLEEKTFA